MRKPIVLLLCLVAINSFAQPSVNPYPKTITVNGSAEMEVIPDEIYEKAEYLLEAINEKRGDAVTITEPNDASVYYFNTANKMYFENSKTKLMDRDQMADGQQAIDFRKIKLKFDVSVVYALK